MPNKRLTMRKIREVLRLSRQGLSSRQIGRICGISHNTVRNHLDRLDRIVLGWPLTDGLTEADLERRLFPPPPEPGPKVRKRGVPDWVNIHQEPGRKTTSNDDQQADDHTRLLFPVPACRAGAAGT